MIGYLRGILRHQEEGEILVDCQGVGYEVSATRAVIEHSVIGVGEEIELYIHTLVREDELSLFGFQTRSERAAFLMLTGVSGVGPRSALAIISGVGEQGFVDAVASGNTLPLTKVKGIGKRTAERIVLDLKDRIGKVFSVTEATGTTPAVTAGNPAMTEAEIALVGLGFRKTEIARAFQEIPNVRKKNVETLIREGLVRLR